MVGLGEIALDSTKMHASACCDRNRGYASIVEEILDEAEQTDRAEDERFGEARGDELPEQLRTREGRRAALEEARERLHAEREARRDAGEEVIARVELELSPERFVTRPEERQAWLRQGRRELEAKRDRQARVIPVGVRTGSLRSSAGSMKSLRSRTPPTAATSGIERRGGCATGGGSAPRRILMCRRCCPRARSTRPTRTPGVMIQKGQPPMQGYNAQAAVTTGQLVVGADVINDLGGLWAAGARLRCGVA